MLNQTKMETEKYAIVGAIDSWGISKMKKQPDKLLTKKGFFTVGMLEDWINLAI